MNKVSLIDGHVDDSAIKDRCPFCGKPVKMAFSDGDGFCNCVEKFFKQSKKWESRKNKDSKVVDL